MAENLPQPESREETFLAKAAGEDVTLPEPESRKELFLKAIAENGGGGGGGTSYTAGDGIEIANNTISVDTTAIQEKLTAGANITIADNVISATGGGSAVTQLTSSDYNWNETAQDAITTPFDSVALWLLPAGYYRSVPGVKVLLNISKQAYGYPYYSCCFLVAKATGPGVGSMADILELTSDEAPDQTPRFYRTDSNGGAVGDETNGAALLSSWGLHDSTGTSTTSTMSQNAISSMVFHDAAQKTQVQIGASASSNKTNSIAVGRTANANGDNGMALGYSATAGKNSVALGKSATTSRVGEVNIGAGNSGDGYNNTNYRLLGGVHDPLDNHDAATKSYVDSAYSAFTGATPSANGTAGLVPAPNIADRDKFLKADGTWTAVSGGGGGGGNTSIRDLNSNDLNWNTTAGDNVTTPFDVVALWLMPSGTYYVPETFTYGILPNIDGRADYAAPNTGSFITVNNAETSGVPAIIKCTGDFSNPFTEVQEIDYDTGDYANGTYEDSETHTLATGIAAGQFGALWVSPDDPNSGGIIGRLGDLCSDTTNFDLYMCTYSDPSVPESTWTKLNMSNNP